MRIIEKVKKSLLSKFKLPLNNLIIIKNNIIKKVVFVKVNRIEIANIGTSKFIKVFIKYPGFNFFIINEKNININRKIDVPLDVNTNKFPNLFEKSSPEKFNT